MESTITVVKMADKSTRLSSRIIVKNLPKKMKEKHFMELFSECGNVTDCKLMMSERGTFRRFGFIGYASHNEAESAVKRFHSTYIKATKISVELAKPYGDDTIARPWSKYSRGSTSFSVLHPEEKKGAPQNSKENKKASELSRDEQRTSTLTSSFNELCELQEDPDFQEFLEAHNQKGNIKMWSNDELSSHKRDQKKASKKEKKSKSASVDSKEEQVDTNSSRFKKSVCGSENEEGSQDLTESSSTTAPRNPLEYLKTKVVKDDRKDLVESDTSSSSSNEDDSADVVLPKTVNSGHFERASGTFTVKMLGLPFSVQAKDIHEFFHPLSIEDIRWTKDNQGRPSGRAYVDFKSKKDLVEALRRNGDYIKDRYIELFRDDGPVSTDAKKPVSPKSEQKLKPWEVKALQGSSDGDEDIADTGRLFVRNLSYMCSEEDLSDLFSVYGPLTEIDLPLDKDTNKVIGYAFITFMFPEHAVKAYSECDGVIFLGRLLHILPAKLKSDPKKDSDEGMSFKKQKEKKLKKTASSSHNWNTLFLGSNAVADSMAQRYDTEKSSILDTEGSQSVAVRMALGETQLVSETREFLESNGVNLDVFNQPGVARSSMTMIVKNLPFGTQDDELVGLFSPFGNLDRVLLPPGGISALVEFTEPGHAKAAFRSLAYTKFKHLPLYLEWAPEGAIDPKKVKQKTVEVAQDSEDKSAVSVQATVFVKNLNFSTEEASLEELFSPLGSLSRVSIARKRNVKDPSSPLSMGYGFVEFESPSSSQDAIKQLQGADLDGHKLQLKMSNRETVSSTNPRKTVEQTKQTGAKILVRNIPFEATKREISELFKTFGEIKILRLPKKAAGSHGGHRGFAFVEYTTKEAAKEAFKTLSLSTHLYGRRLVLEWATDDDSVEALRKRTAEQFFGTKPPKRKSRQIAQDLLFSLESTPHDDSALD